MFQTKTWRPVLYLKAHHEHRDIWAYYRHADFCMVTSLHDGMNLVAKEFVSVRDDEDGVLILSRRSEEHTSELQSQSNLVCRLLLEKKKITNLVYMCVD